MAERPNADGDQNTSGGVVAGGECDPAGLEGLGRSGEASGDVHNEDEHQGGSHSDLIRLDDASADLPPLFGYQEESVDFIIGRLGYGCSTPGRGILYVDPGLGKSRILLECVRQLGGVWGQPSRYEPLRKILIVCSKKALNTWRREWVKWGFPEHQLNIVAGTKAQREKLWEKNARAYVCTYQTGMRDGDQLGRWYWDIILADECKVLRNRRTKTFKFWLPWMRNTKHVILADGTLVSRGPQDLWTFLHICKPKTYPSFWRYANTFCNIVEGVWGKEIVGVRNQPQLRKALSTVCIRIRDNDPRVASQRPPLMRDFIPLKMSQEQRDIYNDLSEEQMHINMQKKLVVATPSVLGVITKQRQLLVCPKLLHASLGFGPAIEHLLLEMEDDPHVVVFTPFAKAIPHIKQAILHKGFPMPFVLQGGCNDKDVRMVEEGFDAPNGSGAAVIVSVKFAESFELPSAKQCFFVGYDWDPTVNYQAEKRLLRITTPHPVSAWYYSYSDTVDGHILDRLNQKQHTTTITFKDYQEVLERLADQRKEAS